MHIKNYNNKYEKLPGVEYGNLIKNVYLFNQSWRRKGKAGYIIEKTDKSSQKFEFLVIGGTIAVILAIVLSSCNIKETSLDNGQVMTKTTITKTS